jgi:hypothetical protein
VDGDRLVDLDALVTVTDADRDALMALRRQSPSWLNWHWRTLLDLVPASALRERPTASPRWEPFRLD